MAYTRKTTDQFLTQAKYGRKWETESVDVTETDGNEMLASYRANKRIPYRLIKKRVKIG